MSDLFLMSKRGFTKTVYNFTAINASAPDGPPFPPGILQYEVGSQKWVFVIDKGRADLTVSAADVAKVADGTAWKLVWQPAVGPQEILDQGVTKTLTPCCGD